MLIDLLAQGDGQGLIDWFTTETAPHEGTLEFGVIFARLSCAAIVGWVLGFGYRLSFTGKKMRPTMHHTLIMLCLGGALVWLVVGDSIVRAFGLAGTIGLIRYRTTLRDPKDTTVLFFSMVLGMAIGLGHYATAIIGCLFVFGALCLMRVTYVAPPPKEKKELAPFGDPVLDPLGATISDPQAQAPTAPQPPTNPLAQSPPATHDLQDPPPQ